MDKFGWIIKVNIIGKKILGIRLLEAIYEIYQGKHFLKEYMLIYVKDTYDI